MKSIKTETLLVSCGRSDSLESIFSEAEQLLITDKKKPLRMVLLELSRVSATLLVFFIYET